jgi:hypothetical protein
MKITVPPANEAFEMPLPNVGRTAAALAPKLATVANQALEKACEIMRAPFDPNNGILARAQTAVVNAALSTQARVDETELRRRQIDVIPKLLELMAEEAKKIPPRTGDNALLDLTAIRHGGSDDGR